MQVIGGMGKQVAVLVNGAAVKEAPILAIQNESGCGCRGSTGLGWMMGVSERDYQEFRAAGITMRVKEIVWHDATAGDRGRGA